MEFTKAVETSYSKVEVFEKMGWPNAGSSWRKFDKLREQFDVDTSHFNTGHSRRKYPRREKICPSCGNSFTALIGSPKERTTCSKSCAARHFKTGDSNPNWTGGHYSYREICFREWGTACLVCGEDKVVEVHHMDEDRSNNDPENLRPLCPTHHAYMHRGFSELIIEHLTL